MAENVIIKKSLLSLRPSNGGQVWDERIVTITEQFQILIYTTEGHSQPDIHKIDPSCSVFQTNLAENAFEIVTPKKILHLRSPSREETISWITTVKDVITRSRIHKDNIVLRASLIKSKADIFYEVEFRESKPLGVVLERSGEWAVVKVATAKETGVMIGSILTQVNGDSVVLESYQSTIDRLKNWKPPLKLGFRRTPIKTGFLKKHSKAQRSSSNKESGNYTSLVQPGLNGIVTSGPPSPQRVWKRKFFSLENGRLQYRDNDCADAPIKGQLLTR